VKGARPGIQNRRPGKLTVTTNGISSVSQTSVQLRALINPNYQETSYSFEYATSEEALLKEEGTSVPEAATLPARLRRKSLALGEHRVTADVTGLAPNRTYFYRLVAKDPTGMTDGPIRRSSRSRTRRP
jgi:phosphodiesterase/alkaline phosphatase D-like protein